MSRARISRQVAVAALLALCPLCPGCRCWPTAATDAYSDALGLFLAGHHTSAEAGFRAFLVEHPSSPYAGDAHYFLGAIALKQGRTREAESHFRSSLAAPRNEAMATGGAVGIARCYLRRGSYRQCVEGCREVLEDRPSCPRADEVLFVMAEALEADGQATEARRYYAQVAERFPSGAWAPKAQERLRGGAATPAASAGGRYCVQVAALGSAARAAEHARRFRQRGYPASVVPLRSGGQVLHAVRLGPYASVAAARRVAATLRGQGFDAIVKP